MEYTYEQSFFNDEQIETLFANAQQSMLRIHEEQGPYKHIADFLTSKLGMRDPLCVQTFYIGEGYDIPWPHIDVATAIYPSITNLWFCADDCPGESFGFLESTGREELYKDWFAALERGEVADFESLCTEDLVDQYYKVTDYKKGDALFFDSRHVHKKLSSTPRKTLVFKYINSEDLKDRTPINYGRIPTGPDWVRILIFDHLRFIEGHAERQRFIRESEALIASATAANRAAAKPSPKGLKGKIRKLLG